MKTLKQKYERTGYQTAPVLRLRDPNRRRGSLHRQGPQRAHLLPPNRRKADRQPVRRQDSQSISAFSENASAVRRGLNIEEKMVACNLTDSEAYTMERQMIGNYHKWHAGQLWNTIDGVQWTQRICRRNGQTRSIRLYRISRPFNELLDLQLDRMDRRAS